MFNQARAFLLSLTILAVLIFSAVGTTVVYADDTLPPPLVGEEPPTQPDEPGINTGALLNNRERSEEPILTTVPDGTGVAVVTAEGVLQPLVAQAAANALGNSDPIWCPAGQLPTPGLNGCTQSFTSFTALLTFLANNSTTYGGAGIIYVQLGTYQGGESTINFSNFNLPSLVSSDLTITGGWNTASGNIEGTSTLNNTSLIIGNSSNPWGGSLTLNNLEFNNPAQTGISLNTQGNITLNSVSVTNSTNGAGAELTAGGFVTIDKSTFLRNKTAGAIIRATGGVGISESTFSSPETARRQIVGLDIESGESVSLFRVLANNNRQAGATITAVGRVTIVESEFNGTKSKMGSEFLGYGLKVVSQDAIDLDGVSANDNFLWGASLTAAGDVTIANSTFNANTTESDDFIDDTGLLVVSGGNVSIFNSHADDNRLIGATIEAAGDVSISNSTFSSNNGVLTGGSGNESFYGYGLQVTTPGNISLNGVTASGNTLFGAHLEAGQDVTIANSDFSNNTSGQATLTGRGLEVIAGGDVFLDTVTLNNNQTFGAHIQSDGDVFLNTVTASGNGTNGVEVETTNCGTLFLIGGNYSNNGQYGLSVIGTELMQSVAPVFENNGSGNIFEDPGSCVFTPPPPPPPVYQPNDNGTVVPDVPAQTLSSDWSTSGTATLNSFLALYDIARQGLQIGPFTGKYGYVYLSSGMQIVMYSPNSLQELAMNGS
jgi:hypothetical protein